MNKLFIVCIEDQREVLTAIAEDLAELEGAFVIEECESAGEAMELLDEIDAAGNFLPLVISDHVMPGKSGVDFLIDLHRDKRFEATRTILLTGLATHQDTIRAINRAAIDRYIEKPWERATLLRYAKELITGFLIDKGIDYQPYLAYLDRATLFERLRMQG